jgi:TonB-linked SusC/RagA family outer membrane protein
MSKIKQLLHVVFLLSCATAMAQERIITGTVTSATKGPVIGATVSQKGTKIATSTAENGSFNIKVTGNSPVLIISSIGFTTQEFPVTAGATTASVTLQDDSKQLGEVVVTALGISRQSKTLVYAAQVIKPAELTGVRDANNVLNSLQGKVANAIITQGSGGPGSGARIVLRGNRSLQQSNNALIVVDGVPITNNTYNTAGSDFGSVQSSDGASGINPDDIESMTVLRGASAAALYGSQAGNGVIVIATKKGTPGKLSVSVNSGLTFESAYALPKVQNSYGQGNAGVLDVKSGESWGAKMTGQSITNYLGKSSSYSAQPDNIKDFFRTGTSINNYIGLSGGTDKMQTYLSYTNNRIQGIIPGNELNRNTVTIRLVNQFSKRFSTDAKITYVNQRIDNRPRTGEENAPAIDIYQIPRNVSTAEAKNYETLDNVGISMPTAWPSTLTSIYQNPYWLINKSAINEKRDRVMGFLQAKFKFTDWLSIQARANIDKIFDRGESLYSSGTILWASQAGGYYDNLNLTTTKQWYDAMIEGNNRLGRDFKIDYRVGGIFQDDRLDALSSVANGLNVTNKFSLNYATNPQMTSAASQIQVQSVFAQANVSYRNAIFLDASLRNDWDSRIASPYTYQYPSVGVSAVLSDLMIMPQPFSFLKLSANYAEVGNGGKPQLLKATYSYSQGAGNGFLQRSTTLPFPDLKPEIVKSFEASVEARFLNNRIGFTATYYRSNSFNQLLQLNLPTASGYGSKYINAGNIQNQGFELVVNGTAVHTHDFLWDLTFNLGLNRNKIVRLDPAIVKTTLGGGYGRSGTPIVQEGGSYGDLVAFQWLRDAKGALVVNANGTPLTTDVNGGQQGYIGNFNPKATLGLTNSFEYKRFSLRLLVDGRAGGVVVSGTEMNLAFSGITAATEQYRDAGSWSLGGVDKNGTAVSAKINAQQFWQTASGKRYGVGEFFAYNATNFRVRELSIGYNIPVGAKFFIKDARFSLVARNLLWLYRGKSLLAIPGLEKRKMWFDPDMSLGNGNFQGVEYGTLPATRSLGFNLRLTF